MMKMISEMKFDISKLITTPAMVGQKKRLRRSASRTYEIAQKLVKIHCIVRQEPFAIAKCFADKFKVKLRLQ
jgi:hypothetical protein